MGCCKTMRIKCATFNNMEESHKHIIELKMPHRAHLL